jgi:hypothetical protein
MSLNGEFDRNDQTIRQSAGLTGHEIVVARLYTDSHKLTTTANIRRPNESWILKCPNGKLVVIKLVESAFLSRWVRVDTAEADAIMSRYAGRSQLKKGDRVEAITCIERLNKHCGRLEEFEVPEPCIFDAFARDGSGFAWVWRPDGSHYLTPVFEPYHFHERERVWARVNERWVVADVLRIESSGAVQLEADLFNQNGTYLSTEQFTATLADLLTERESIPCQLGERVRACIGGRWFDNCTFKGGKLGEFEVRTRYLQRKIAKQVKPMHSNLDERFHPQRNIA